MTHWLWTDDPYEGWCGDHATRESALAEARSCNTDAESFWIGETESVPDDERIPIKFLRTEEVDASTPPIGTGEKP